MKKYLLVLPGILFQISLSGQTTGSWGDQGNGTFINPVLNSDYSDPDVIRVENKYYMVCSKFHFMGIPVLESDDMVNWKIVGRVYDNIGLPGYDTNEKYGRGSWAPSLRFHDNKFWIYFCTPDEGVTVYTGPVAEGTKIHKMNGYYYLSIPEGGVERGWQTILRSKTISGPYEKKVVHLQPVIWQEGWPVIGVDIDRNEIGEPVYVWKKPNIKGDFGITAPQADDDFSSTSLGLQWQWNHNPVNTNWSLTEKPGMLVLKALKSENFSKARNTLTQKVMGTTGKAATEMVLEGLADG